MDKEYCANEENLPTLLAKDLRKYSNQFVECYWSFVRNYAYQLTRSDEEAEVLRQEVFECVLRALERKSAEEIECIKFRGYLCKATRNCYYNIARSRRKHQLVESLDAPVGMALQEILEDENTHDGQPDIAFEEKEFRREVRAFLNILPEVQRVAVVLRYGLRFGYSSIARVLRISEREARSLVREGKKKLRDVEPPPSLCR